MPITQKQRKNRVHHLGSSDIPAILGFSRFASAADVWLQKTGRIPIEDEETVEDWQEAGNYIEGSVLDWAQKKGFIQNIERDPEITVPDIPIVVHIDAVERETGNPVEVKTEGLFGPVWSPWGEAGTDEIPEYTCIQAQTHMLATERGVCHIPTFLGGRGFGYYYCERDEGLIEIIRKSALKFWEEYVVKDTPPPDSVPSLELAKKIRHVEGDPKPLADELVEQWLEAKEAAKNADQQKRAMQAKILAALDGVQEGTCSQGLITNFEQHRKETIQRASTFRVMRLKKVKA